MASGEDRQRPTLETEVLDEAAMIALAARLATELAAPLVVFLEGDLGAGKTTFVRALIQGLGHPGRVKSPTYGLLEHYELGAMEVLHLDLYRIGDPGELEYLGISDLHDERSLLLIEWPERGEGALPAPDLSLRLQEAFTKQGVGRRLSFYAHSNSGIELCRSIKAML
ncbi:MAG: tRNA (adenosine(37)-N6)-threonylcarbamoyltransferase complex ATPase subunit type 1 TsaE [Xanthomonadales bacterium]|nr:tRNA (adenosine(37)-N6)-threonylcarbamoyltransferase complex ATPase subunit type 1 TsaE [Xanthomonadales bacterium]